jgi:class 3 adenylate cyclase
MEGAETLFGSTSKEKQVELEKGIVEALRGTLRGRGRSILFTDVEGSTAVTRRLGDVKAREVLRDHERITREVLKQHRGTEIKTMGDGFMASFPSASSALAAAVAIQKAFADHNLGHPDTPIHVRIGLNAGEPVAWEEEDAAQLAAQIRGYAEPGQILTSHRIKRLGGRKGFSFSDKKVVVLKELERPVPLYELEWR